MALVDLALAKEHLRLDADDSSEDLSLNGMIDDAVAVCELHTGRFAEDAAIPPGSDVPPLSDAERLLMRRAALLILGKMYQDRETADLIAGPVKSLLRPLLYLAR